MPMGCEDPASSPQNSALRLALNNCCVFSSLPQQQPTDEPPKRFTSTLRAGHEDQVSVLYLILPVAQSRFLFPPGAAIPMSLDRSEMYLQLSALRI